MENIQELNEITFTGVSAQEEKIIDGKVPIVILIDVLQPKVILTDILQPIVLIEKCEWLNEF